MPPNNDVSVLDKRAGGKEDTLVYSLDEKTAVYDQQIKWFNVFGLTAVHLIGIYGLAVGVPQIKVSTFSFYFLYGICTGLGITAGVHRYWSHRSYKANLPLRVILMLCYASAGQNKLHTWVRDHRVHHKFSETPADPHNAKRGIFFSHIGWLMKKKHPACLQQGRKIDMSDIKNDQVVQFFDNNFVLMKTLWCFLLPTLFTYYAFGELGWIAFCGNMARYMITLNCTWVINSIAHNFGHHPYDKNIGPSDSQLASALAFGEGWHNYHHTFPWDYRTSEFGLHSSYNLPTAFIDFFARIGWAYDRKTTTTDMVLRQAKKKGDGSRFVGGIPIAEVKEEF